MICRPDASAFAVGAVLDRADGLMREIPGASSDDPEGLHRARVASRRLELALRLLGVRAGLPDDAGLLKSIRSVARALGAVRDLDVQTMWLGNFAGACSPREKPGVRRLALRLSQRREKLQGGAAKTLSGFSRCGAFRDALQSLRGAKCDMEIQGAGRRADDGWHIARAMIMRIDLIVRLASSLGVPEAHEAHHKLRIETKRLRYAMEIASGLFGDVMAPHIATARRIQDLLGDLHDAHVWVESVPGLSARELRRTTRYFGTTRPFTRLEPGYAAVARDRLAFRRERYEKAKIFWLDLSSAGCWAELREMLLDAAREDTSG
ncbi:MAG: CHAD domain-containing protein [Synergistaceae bacterium]|jgi:CHAD domain-containing protein|nr:CHAD domain-containing protein [Synergistaceae bacterium]